MALFLASFCLPLTLGITFAFYRHLRNSGVAEHTSLILAAITLVLVSGVVVSLVLWLWT